MNPVKPSPVLATAAKTSSPKKSVAVAQLTYEEGNHCFAEVKRRQQSSSGSSGESGENQVFESCERIYPEVAGVEFAHCFNYGNWRILKSQSTKSQKGNSVTVWKC